MRVFIVVICVAVVGCGGGSTEDGGSGGGSGATGGGRATDGGATGGGSSSCPGVQSFCMGACRDVTSDSAFCGDCFTACSSGSSCVGSRCEFAQGGGTGSVGGGTATGGGGTATGGGGTATGGGGTVTGGGTATATCGDGVVAPSEACDDGNTSTTDGCAQCTVTVNYVCTGQPSTCTTTTFRVNNGTSFPLVSVVIDGVERIPARQNNACFGYASGTYAEFQVTPNQSHTWSAINGGVTDDTTCNDLSHETWGPLTFTQPAGLYQQTLTNRALTAYVNNDFGNFTYSCWLATYSDGTNTRLARLRLNNDGTWRFQETYNLGGVTRTANGPSWPEQSRTIDHRFTYRLQVNANTFWNARWERSGGHYVQNGIVGASLTTEILYLRQTNGVGGAPTNCPP